MPIRPLPNNPSLENLRKQAKRLLDEIRAGDAAALARVREFHPQPPPRPALHDAQRVLARGHGFASWTRLVQHLEGVDRFTWDPSAGEPPVADIDRLVRWACLDYGRWQRADLDGARRLLAEDPALARANIYTAAATGEVETVRSLLAAEPRLANTPGGPNAWPPLLYACYSRLAAPTLEVARVLLEAGADPDAGFLWCGNVPPFTALTGAFGDGEDGNNQPPHPERDALASALLEAGADPNDGQTLYNRHFRSDDGHLRLLLAHGLGRDHGGPWYARFGDRMGAPADLLVEELWAASRKNFVERVRLLVEHGARVDQPGARDGRTPYEAALMCGNHEIAAYLAAHGARPVALALDQQLAAACIAGRGDEARDLLARHPGLRATLGPHGELELVRRAVEAKRPEGVRLMAELGFALDLPHARTPMHEAAWAGDLALVQLLVELGARTEARDPAYHATPLGWAAHNQQPHVVAYLVGFASIVEAVELGAMARVAELLDGDPALANATDPDGDPVVFSLHRGIARLPALIALLRARGADLTARDRSGRTLVEALAARGDGEVVAALGEDSGG